MKTETAPSSRLEVKPGAVHEIDPGKIDRLCPELRIIRDAELAAGNKKDSQP